ncbi:MAG: ACGX-repeat peptide [Eubacteriales bacterium]|nr:ACGX-repeat peptide [Eubacteriales bacterium]
MALSNLFGWNKKHEAAPAAACGTACGASDKLAEKPAACGSACGAGDKPAEAPAACGGADKPEGAQRPGDAGSAPTEAERRQPAACGAGDK